MENIFEEIVIKEEEKYKGKLITTIEQKVKIPDGRIKTREIVLHSNAIGIIIINNDNKFILVKQWRAAVKQITYEIPAGKIDFRDKDDISAVKRELNEETRLKANNIKKLIEFHPSIGFSNEKITLYLATQIEDVENKLPQDDDEKIEIVKVDSKELEELINKGIITDSKTILGYFFWKQLKEGKC